MAAVVLDASAVLALLRNEPGADIVERAIGAGVISAVNLHEVRTELLASGIPAEIAHQIADELGFDVRAHDPDAVWSGAQLCEADTIRWKRSWRPCLHRRNVASYRLENVRSPEIDGPAPGN